MNQKDVNQQQPKPEPPPPSERERLRARLAEVESDVERAALAMVRLWTQIVDMKKEG